VRIRFTARRATNDRAPSAGAKTPSRRRGITVRRSKVAIAALGLSLSTALTLGLPSASTALAAPSTSAGTSASSGAVKVVSTAVPQNMSAARASDPCKGKSQTYVVRTFIRGPEVFPLRCGTNTWGYNHLVYRAHDYNPALIALTVARGSAPVPGEQVLQWKWHTLTCPTYNYTYTVVYNQGALNGHGVRPQGIITAYESVTVTNTANAAKCG
jgi:hypothetical protein